jgi:hypothetical protein
MSVVLVCNRCLHCDILSIKSKHLQAIWFVFRVARQTTAFHRRFVLLKCR